MNETVKISIRIPKQLHRSLQEEAGEQDRSINKVVERMLREYLWGEST